MAPPIAIGEGFTETVGGEKILNDTLAIFNAELGAPLDDKEFRIEKRKDGNHNSDEPESSKIRIAFGTSDTTYPELENPAFWPTGDQIDGAAAKIIEMIKKSGSDVSELIIESWIDATFRMYDREKVKSSDLVEPEELALNPVEKYVDKPVMKIVVSSSAESIAQAGGDVAEFESGFADEFQEELDKISPNAKSFFENVKVVVQVVAMGEVDFSIEFDGDIINADTKIPTETRKYMANAVLYVLNMIYPYCSGEIWVRQGQPNTSRSYAVE